MGIFPNILDLPSFLTVKTERFETTLPGREETALGDVLLQIKNGEVLLTADTTPVKSVTLRWNGALPQNARFCGDHWERGYGDLEWRGFVPHRIMPWYFFAAAGTRFAFYGVRVCPDALCAFSCDPAGITLQLDVGCGDRGTVLGGRTLRCASLVCRETETADVFEEARKSVSLLADRALTPAFPVYGYNNWYYAYGKSSEAEILASARELASLTEGLENRPYLVIDDCWQKERPTGFIGGDWRVSNAAFPDMAKLASRILSLSVKPGIWMRPLQNKAENIPAGLYREPEDYILDPSLDETLAYVSEDIRVLTGWGYQLIKHDYSSCDILGDWGFHFGFPPVKNGVRFRNRSRTTAEIIKRLYRAIHAAAEGKALILGCNTVGHLGVGAMELSRTGDDTSGRDWERTRKMGVNTLAFRMPQHGAFYAADADCVGITDAVPWEKNRRWMDILANSGTPLFISVAPDTLSPSQLAEIRAALRTAAVPIRPAKPLDWMNNCCPAVWDTANGQMRFDWF